MFCFNLLNFNLFFNLILFTKGDFFRAVNISGEFCSDSDNFGFI